jgi:serine/threonine protein phosphatase 1
LVLSRFFKGSGKRVRRGPASLRAYGIGDVHGRLDLLRDLLARIGRDDDARPPAKTFIVLLGDLVDRGPDSRGVIDYLLAHSNGPARMVFIKGNHEELFLRVLEGHEEVVNDWLTYGGYECAESYGVSQGSTLNATPAEIIERLRAAVPESHRKFLAEMADTFRFGDYLFVHAGIRPGVAVDEQTGKDLRWIREGFLDDRTDHGLVVIHGHTIVEGPEEHPNRIALDTGAYKNGVLTAIGLEGSRRWYVEAREDSASTDSRSILAS